MSTRQTTATNYQYECLEGSGYVWSSESLQLAGEAAAPVSRFNQNKTYLENRFEPGMKLESDDPRRINMDATCIATVIGSQGPRVRLRLDGSDSKNDFWRMIDSEDLRTIGTCESKNGLLQPPLGFTKQPIHWNNFRKKTLSNAKYAEQTCFHEPPPPPNRNTFVRGEKLEAVDRKNPQLICPATVGEIRGDEIHVCFDGWRGAFDYWCRYTDRDIYPVGWSALNDHPLQHPGVVHQPVKRSKSTPANTTKFEIDSNLVTTSTISPKPGITVEGSQSHKNKPFHIPKSNSISNEIKPNLFSPNAASPATDFPRNSGNAQHDLYDHKHAKIPRNQEIPFRRFSQEPIDARNWNSEEVVEFIGKLDKSLRIYVEKFKDLEIDGSAFLLMDSEKFMKYMSLKLGPALKLADIAHRLRTGRFMKYMLEPA